MRLLHDAPIELRDQEVISDEVLRRLEDEVNLEGVRAGLGEFRVPRRRPGARRAD